MYDRFQLSALHDEVMLMELEWTQMFCLMRVVNLVVFLTCSTSIA
jgi:hypothetical protein